jgi:hypothetical protein
VGGSVKPSQHERAKVEVVEEELVKSIQPDAGIRDVAPQERKAEIKSG